MGIVSALEEIPCRIWLYITWAAIMLFAVAILVSNLSHAATLSISGNAIGNGSQLFQVAGENITAIWSNNSWNVTGAI